MAYFTDQNLSETLLLLILEGLAVALIIFIFIKEVVPQYKFFFFSPKYAWQDIIESTDDGIIIIDFNHAIRYSNKAFSNMMGYTEEEIRRRDILLLFPDEENLAKFLVNMNRRKKGLSDKYTLQAKTKSGAIITCRINARPYYDKKKNVIGSVAIVENITEMLRLEKTLEQKIKDLNQFIYKTHHDLRAPLTSALGLCNLYDMEVDDVNTSKYIELIRRSVLKLDAVLKDLQRISILTNCSLTPMPFNVNTEIEKIKQGLKKLEFFPHVHFNQEIKENEIIFTDKELFITIVQNILSNAIQYLDLKKEKSIVKIQVKRTAGSLEIIIEDNGIGICKQYQAKVWEIFFRGNENISGRGIGLYIVKIALERLKGTVTYTSEHGKGTKFVLQIPDLTPTVF